MTELTKLNQQAAELRAKIANDKAHVSQLSNAIRSDEWILTLIEDQITYINQINNILGDGQ